MHLAETNPRVPDATDLSNWLPIPAGEFSVTFRAYCPRDPIVLGGDGWHLEPVQELA